MRVSKTKAIAQMRRARVTHQISGDHGCGQRSWDAPILACLAVVATIVWLPVLWQYFSADDFDFLIRAKRPVTVADLPFRFLARVVAWKAGRAVFGVDPLPYNAARLLMHIGVVWLVYLVGRRLMRTSPAAALGALLFAVSPIAFTPLHWASAQGDIGCALFALAATYLLLRLGRCPRVWVVAGTVGCSTLAFSCKEVAALLAVPWLVLTFWPRTYVSPHARLTRVWAVGLVGLLGIVMLALCSAEMQLGGAPYEMTFNMGHLLRNAATYAYWGVGFGGPVPDQVAAVDSRAWPIGMIVIGGLSAGAAWANGGGTVAGMFGAAWCVAFLMPVMPLAHHTYLYYLYGPAIGACWVVGACGERALGGVRPSHRALAYAITCVTVTVLGASGVRSRESVMANGLPMDRTVRDGVLLRNAVGDLRACVGERVDTVGFVNPYPVMYQNIASRSHDLQPEGKGRTYIPLEAAMRGGDVLAVMLPGLRLAGFAELPPSEWRNVSMFAYNNEGHLLALGRGDTARVRLGALALSIERWDFAGAVFKYLVERGDTSADVAYGRIHSLAGLGRDDEANELVADFVSKHPADPRGQALWEWLRERRTASVHR